MTKSLEALIAAFNLAIKSATPGQWTFSRAGANTNVKASVTLQRGGAARAVLCSLKSSLWRNQLATAQDAAFIALANPENVSTLIAALEQSKHESSVNWEAATSLVEENEQLKRRIAELEASLLSVKLSFSEIPTDEAFWTAVNSILYRQDESDYRCVTLGLTDSKSMARWLSEILPLRVVAPAQEKADE